MSINFQADDADLVRFEKLVAELRYQLDPRRKYASYEEMRTHKIMLLSGRRYSDPNYKEKRNAHARDRYKNDLEHREKRKMVSNRSRSSISAQHKEKLNARRRELYKRKKAETTTVVER